MVLLRHSWPWNDPEVQDQACWHGTDVCACVGGGVLGGQCVGNRACSNVLSCIRSFVNILHSEVSPRPRCPGTSSCTSVVKLPCQIGAVLAAGLVIGMMQSGDPLVSPGQKVECAIAGSMEARKNCMYPNTQGYTLLSLMVVLIISFCSISVSTPTFGPVKPIYWRECQAGLRTLA